MKLHAFLRRNSAARGEALLREVLCRFRAISAGGAISFLSGVMFFSGNSTILSAADTSPLDAPSLPAKADFFGDHAWPPFDPSNPDNASPTNLPAGDRFFRMLLSPGPQPDPLGDVVLTFPTNTLLAPRIVDISGRYRGLSDTASNRSFSVDIVQDESGKLSLLCTVDGLLGKTGSSQIGGFGFIRSVQGKPMLRLRGSLTGTLDGLPLRGSGGFSAPAALDTFSAGSYGLVSTGSYSGRLGDTPFSGRKRPIQIPLLADAGTNVHDAWTLALNFHRKPVGKNERTFVSGRLFMPSGSTIQFPERPAHYTKSGYTLSFASGTNITANPPVRNRRASIGIRNMRLTQQGDSLTVSSGIIRYRFLGQAGSADLVDFLPASANSVARKKPLSR